MDRTSISPVVAGERHCKNCGELIYAQKSYCASCGAKWVENRITMRNVAQDFSDMYLGFDTKFVRTFIDLFRRPEAVINGYIHGRRNYYVDAIRYLLVAIFVSGLYSLYLSKSGFFDEMMTTSSGAYEVFPQTEESRKFNERFQAVFKDFFLDFQGLITILTIPLLALVARITFWGKRFYNFTEQIVFYLYTFSQYSIASSPVFILLIWISPSSMILMSTLSYPIIIGYIVYAYTRCLKISVGQAILRALISLIVLSLLFLVVMVIFIVVFLAIIAIIGKDAAFGLS